MTSIQDSHLCYPHFQANSPGACQRACAVEAEFLCRSYLYTGPTDGQVYNCKLYHMDHWTLPDGAQSFKGQTTSFIQDSSRIGTFYENKCARKSIIICLPFNFILYLSCPPTLCWSF